MITVGWNENPNVIDDLQKYVFPDSDKDVLKGKMERLQNSNLDNYQKVIRYLDILELIHHMKIVAEEAKIQHYLFHGEEIEGLDADINALVFYLALASIDVIVPDENYCTFSDWIREEGQLADFDYKTDIHEYIETKYAEYQGHNGMLSGFYKAVFGMPEEFQKKVVQNVTYLKVKSKDDFIDIVSSCKSKDAKEYEKILKFCIKFRNIYTHDMYRVQQLQSSNKLPTIISKGNDMSKLWKGENTKKIEILKVENGFKLEDAILEISLSYCRDIFK